MSKYKVIKVGKIIDGNGSTPIDNGVIVIEDNKLLKVGTEKDIKIDQYKNHELIPNILDSLIYPLSELLLFYPLGG